MILVGNMVTSTKGSKTEAQEPQDCPFSIEELPGHKCLRYRVTDKVYVCLCKALFKSFQRKSLQTFLKIRLDMALNGLMLYINIACYGLVICSYMAL